MHLVGDGYREVLEEGGEREGGWKYVVSKSGSKSEGEGSHEGTGGEGVFRTRKGQEGYAARRGFCPGGLKDKTRGKARKG